MAISQALRHCESQRGEAISKRLLRYARNDGKKLLRYARGQDARVPGAPGARTGLQ